MAEPEPEREGSYVPWDVQVSVGAQKSLEQREKSPGVDPAAELLSLTGGGKASDVPEPELEPEPEPEPFGQVSW
jgi:hypothetical protein